MNIYGITTCGSVKKALTFFKSRGIPYTFVDLKTIAITPGQLDRWLMQQPMSILFNTKGTKFKTLGLSKELSELEKKEWLLKEQLLFKRPIIECDNGELLVGFDEERYTTLF